MSGPHFLTLYLASRDRLSEEDRAALAALPFERKSFENGEVIIPEDAETRASCLVIRGMAARSHELANGARRLSALHVPGDFVDLHGFLLKRLDHSVVACGATEVEFTSHDSLRDLTRERPHLTRLLWLVTVIDAAIHRQWIVAAASLLAHERVAHLLCELSERLGAVGLARDGGFDMPLRQRDLADLFGLSAIHVNRSVQDLRGRGLIDWTRRDVTIHDMTALRKLAKFSPDYLNLRVTPR